MRSWSILRLLCCACVLVEFVQSQDCSVKGAQRDKDFPDIEKAGIGSYQLSVEYTVPGAKESAYYTEYYDILMRRGRVEGHQAGTSQTYIYRTESWEAWELTDKTCKLQNLTTLPTLGKVDMNDWLYRPLQNTERWTYGPSSMFKFALDTWKGPNKEKEMGYMGEFETKVRGLKAQYWKRCDTPTSYVEYFFTTDDEEDPEGLGRKTIPLRVVFGGKRLGRDEAMSTQQFEVMNFQPFISPDVQAFELPKGKGCKRGDLADTPDMPDFSKNNLQFQAEVVYRKVDYNEDDYKLYSYYSNIMFALDLESEHLAYYYSPWNSSTPENGQEPTALAPEYVIYDMKHGYTYKTNMEKGNCDISRDKSFVPKYKLPNNAGEISLTDPSILFPNNELSFISEGETRGLKVNIFEEIVSNYVLDPENKKPAKKAVISHSYLKEDEEIITNAYVEKALVQVQLRLYGREEKVVEIITINFFGFSTQLSNRRYVFNVQRCFKNDDDYSWVTLGFNADNSVIEKIKDDVPMIQANVLGMITSRSELNPVRVPRILVDINDGVIFVTALIFGKPPVELDYLPEEVGKTITGSTEVEGVQDLQSCATKCLETEDNCWGFSICGATCTFGLSDKSGVKNQANCKLYRRYNNNTYIPSRQSMIENLKEQVKENLLKLVLPVKGQDQPEILDCTSIEVTDPGEDEEYFNRIGNNANPRMRVVKAGAKLKAGEGKPIKNLGKLRFEQCQQVCLDFKQCETVSYCLRDSVCVVSSKYGEDLLNDIEADDMCSVITRKYIDHFNRSPGIVLSASAEETVDVDTEEQCARACLKSTKYDCLSFDHCQEGEKPRCRLHKVHYTNAKSREPIQVKKHTCGHYYRKFSTEFKKTTNKRLIGSSIPPISNLTLEECSKTCKEYGKGTCFGFDFCQDVVMLATSCVLLDSDPSRLKSTYSEVCTNYLRGEPEFAPKPYSQGYAGGIGFLCFIIGLVVGTLTVFAIAYIKVNRR